MARQADKRKCISVSQQTKDTLDSIKHAGQSYSGLIRELVNFWQEKKVSTGPPRDKRKAD